MKECLEDYKLDDAVEALKNCFGIREGKILEKAPSKRPRLNKLDTSSVKECLQPSVPSTFQALVHELRDTVREGYWNKEIGRTIYLPPHLPAGCDPTGTTFGKATTRDEYGVAAVVNPRIVNFDDDSKIHELYRKSHNDYYPSEQIDRKYFLPFDKNGSFGGSGKPVNFSGKKVANCIQWYKPEAQTLVSRRLADFSNRTGTRLGRGKNRDEILAACTFGKNVAEDVEKVADVLRENVAGQGECYCSEYAEKISKMCGPSEEIKTYVPAGVPAERTDVPYVVLPERACQAEKENLGDQTSAMALISPNIFTQMGLSHIEFFKIRGYEEMRSIFESIGVEFPDNCFDIIWNEGLRKDCTGGVCVETFRNLLGRVSATNYTRT